MITQTEEIHSHIYPIKSLETLTLKSKSSSRISLRLLMSCRETGCIIGKNGIAIKSFRKKSGAKIKISDKGGSERIVTICGHSREINTACKIICEKLEMGIIRSRTLPEICLKSFPESRAYILIRLLIPATFCGSIIGKSGSNIKHIMKLTGSRVKISSLVVPNSNERVLFTAGSATSVCQCLKKICNLILELSSSAKTIPYNPIHSDLNNVNTLTESHLNFPITMNHERYRQLIEYSSIQHSAENSIKKRNMKERHLLQKSSGNKLIKIYAQRDIRDANLVKKEKFPDIKLYNCTIAKVQTIPCSSNLQTAPSISNFYRNEAHIRKYFSLLMLPTNPPRPAAEEVTAEDSQHLNYCPRSYNNLSSLLANIRNTFSCGTKTTIFVSNKIVGCVIGRGGIKINEIRRISQAKINIGKNDPCSTFRQITIIGNNHSMQIALALIEESLLARTVME